ncbi:MAG: BspA family leucine-rich repeat surface protein, partial [Flavobacteriales bacterium]|nr:BspA family leucine-rich repeat surface protein [Flavobacteriales bacterium]
ITTGFTGWNTSTISNFNEAFSGATSFNSDISGWNVTGTTSLFRMFYNASSFNQDISSWNVSGISNMGAMFSGAAAFNQNIDGWNTSSLTQISGIFGNATSFNQSLNNWDVSGVSDFSFVFWGASSFNGNVSSWDVSNGTNMLYMFSGSAFNNTISGWNVSSVQNMNSMFYQAAAFNQPIGSWNVSSVTNMSAMFREAVAFDQDISGWNTASLSSMASMFRGATAFNQNINGWNVNNVSSLAVIFMNATSFNQPLSGWNTTGVTSISYILSGATSFDQDLSSWDVSSVTAMTAAFDNTAMSITNYDNTLISWESQSVQNNVTLGVAGLNYCSSETQRAALIADHSWTISGDSKDCTPLTYFISTWKTDNSGTSSNTSITIPAGTGTFNYDVDWDNDGTFEQTGITGSVTHDFGSTGTYTIRIRGTFPAMRFNNSGDRRKILSISQWGSLGWTTMANAFYGCSNLEISASDAPDLSSVSDLSYMFCNCTEMIGTEANWSWNTATITDMSFTFSGCHKFNGNVSVWNTANVTNMNYMFYSCSDFNQNIGIWNIASVQNMERMLSSCNDFNQDISGWNTGSVQNMSAMFGLSTKFNQDISGWNTSSVTNMANMFWGATAFNQDIGGWNTSSVTNMSLTFNSALAFNHHLGDWDVSNVTDMTNMLGGSGLSVANYDTTLMGWAETAASKTGSGMGSTMAVQPNVPLGAFGLSYCNAVTSRQNLIDNNSWVITGDADVCGGLPIELMNFSAYAEDDHVSLEWMTAAEINNSYFEVQRSLDTTSWESLEMISGAGNSNELNKYFTIDPDPIVGAAYYRLKQVDFDGNYSYSPMKGVTFSKELDPYIVKVYPSPSTDLIFVESQGQDLSNIEFYNSMGQLLPLTFLNNSEKQRTYDISKLPQGIYHLAVAGKVQSFMKK